MFIRTFVIFVLIYSNGAFRQDISLFGNPKYEYISVWANAVSGLSCLVTLFTRNMDYFMYGHSIQILNHLSVYFYCFETTFTNIYGITHYTQDLLNNYILFKCSNNNISYSTGTMLVVTHMLTILAFILQRSHLLYFPYALIDTIILADNISSFRYFLRLIMDYPL